MDIDWNAVWAWDFWTWPLWEPLRNWLIAFGGLIALFFAARTYVMNSKAKREDQARKVYTRYGLRATTGAGSPLAANDSMEAGAAEIGATGTRVRAAAKVMLESFIVHNGSDEIIGPVQFTVHYVHGDGHKTTVRSRIYLVEPKSDAEVTQVRTHREDVSPTVLRQVDLAYRDSSGRWWSRRDTRPIRRRYFDQIDPPHKRAREWGERRVVRRLRQRAARRRSARAIRLRARRAFR